MLRNKKTIILVTLFLYAAIALFGMQSHGMGVEHGMVVQCPLLKQGGSMCQTNIPDYVTHWFLVFATVLPLLLTFVAPLLEKAFLLAATDSDTAHAPPLFFTLYNKSRPNLKFFHPFFFVFSRGILHAKIYA